MRSFFARGIIVSLGLALAGVSPGISAAQEYGAPSLLPIPAQTDYYSAALAAHQESVIIEAAPGDNPAPVDAVPSPSDAPLQAPESYKNAMQQ
ncbi:MAG: hypothetical protein ACKVP0_17630, partial [Pirellulaceae bacterium]